ncbi:hypothetical protein ACFYY8_06335 [Streptosporangium sp. NPDC001559]
MLNSVARLFERLHTHRWSLIDSLSNAFVTVELDRCRCGQYRTRRL